MHSAGRILVVGNFVADLIARPLDRLPEPGKLLILDTLETHAGGNAPNTGGALGRLGAAVSVCGRVGQDAHGAFLLGRLEEWGVDIGPVVRDPQATTGATLVSVDHVGERSFSHCFGANAAFTADDVHWDAVDDLTHVHVCGFFVLPALDGQSVAALLAAARGRGLSTSLDVCWDREGRWLENLGPALPFVDIFLPSENEAGAMTGETEPAAMAAHLRDRGCGAVVVKRGALGVEYYGPEGGLACPAFAVEAQDTTGAGDCCIAGYLYGRLRNWELERTLRFACACGARSVQAIGGVTGMAPAPEIEQWMADTPVRGRQAR